MSAAPAVQLDRARARRLTDQLREALDLAVDLLQKAYTGEAWRALGYASWSAYCRAELPQLAIIVKGLPVAERRPKVAQLRAGGMSLRAVGEVTGLSANTVKADAAAEGVQLAEVLSLDGARRAAAVSPAPAKPRARKTDRAVAYLAGAGPDGATVRDVARALRCEQHKAAATLTRLVDAGRILYREPARRGLFGRYTVREF
jgi:thiol-disulfide isomerase/thioredoxin